MVRLLNEAISGSCVTNTMVFPWLCIQFLHQGHDLVRCAAVQVAGGLIGQDHYRLIYQRPGNSHPLLLSAG